MPLDFGSGASSRLGCPVRSPGMPRLGKSTTRTLLALEARDGPGCHYCGRDLDIERAKNEGHPDDRLPEWWPTRDHKQPRSRRGPTHVDNFVLSCQPCNLDKGDRTYESYIQLLAARGAWPRGLGSLLSGPEG